jgi:hypothetical protein
MWIARVGNDAAGWSGCARASLAASAAHTVTDQSQARIMILRIIIPLYLIVGA